MSNLPKPQYPQYPFPPRLHIVTFAYDRSRLTINYLFVASCAWQRTTGGKHEARRHRNCIVVMVTTQKDMSPSTFKTAQHSLSKQLFPPPATQTRLHPRLYSNGQSMNCSPGPLTDPQRHHVVQSYAYYISNSSFQDLILQIPPTAEHPGPTL